MTPTQLQIVISAVNNAQAALDQAASQISGLGTAASGSQQTISQMFANITSAAESALGQLAPVSAALDLASGYTVGNATSLQTATAQGNAYAQATLAQATATGANATQIASLTAQIQQQQAAILTAQANEQNWSGTTAEVTARHAAAAAAITVAQQKIADLQGQLQPLVGVTQLAGVSAQSLATQFSQAADQSMSLGFSFEDSYVSLNKLFATFKSIPDAMAAFQAAQGLSLQAGISLPQATQELMQAQATQSGRQIGQQLGISIKDGLSGTDLISAVQSAVQFAIPDLGNTVGVKFAAAQSYTNEFAATLGSTQSGPITAILNDYDKLAQKAVIWAQTNQGAASDIEGALLGVSGTFSAVMGFLGGVATIGLAIQGFQNLYKVLADIAELTGLDTVFSAIKGLIALNWELFTTYLSQMWIYVSDLAGLAWGYLAAGVELLVDAFIGLAAALGLSVGWLAIILVAIALLAIGVVLYHKQILDAIETCWNTVVNFLANIELNIYNTFVAWGTGLVNWWQGLWNGILSFLSGIIGKIESAISGVLSSISKITSGISGVFSGVGGALGPLAPLLAGSLTMLASGGIVNSPTLALVGEAGPEAVIPLSAFNGGSSLGGAGGIAGGSGNIVININGGSYLDQGGAQQIAQALATMIGKQLKLTTV